MLGHQACCHQGPLRFYCGPARAPKGPKTGNCLPKPPTAPIQVDQKALKLPQRPDSIVKDILYLKQCVSWPHGDVEQLAHQQWNLTKGDAGFFAMRNVQTPTWCAQADDGRTSVGSQVINTFCEQSNPAHHWKMLPESLGGGIRLMNMAAGRGLQLLLTPFVREEGHVNIMQLQSHPYSSQVFVYNSSSMQFASEVRHVPCLQMTLF